MTRVATPEPIMVVALRCRDLPIAHAPSLRRSCTDCDQVIWVSLRTLRAAGPLIVPLCVLCAAGRAAAAEVSR